MAKIAAARVAASRPIAAALQKFSGLDILTLEYPRSATNEPRWGYGRPAHERLNAIISRHDDAYRRELDRLREYVPHLDLGVNPWLGPLDRLSLYAYICRRRPKVYVEIGSGTSTRIARQAIRDAALPTRVVSIDPEPRAEIDAICDESIRRPLESTDLSLFSNLEERDVIFFDGSHRIFMNSDVTTFFVDVLPNLFPGVLVGIHDIHLPLDYPPEAANVYPSEQYLLAAYLLAGGPWIEPVLPCSYIERHPTLGHKFGEPGTGSGGSPSLTFWLQTHRHER
jgi:hypothetical protein